MQKQRIGVLGVLKFYFAHKGYKVTMDSNTMLPSVVAAWQGPIEVERLRGNDRTIGDVFRIKAITLLSLLLPNSFYSHIQSEQSLDQSAHKTGKDNFYNSPADSRCPLPPPSNQTPRFYTTIDILPKIFVM